MTLKDELERAKHEQEAALRAAQEAKQRIEAHRNKIHQAIVSQRQALVAQWTPLISVLLEEVGKSTWGKDGYTLIRPDGVSSLSWFAVRVEGKSKLNYQVTLQVMEPNTEYPVMNPEDILVRPTKFIVAGVQQQECSLLEEALRNAIVSAYKSGPKRNGLDKWAETNLAKSPYKVGEYETTNPYILILPILTFLTGLCAVSNACGNIPMLLEGIPNLESLTGNDWLTIIVAILGILLAMGLLAGIMVISVFALWRTSFGRRFHRLSRIEKALVVVAAIPGTIAGGFIILIPIALIIGLLASTSRAERVSEIEEAVRRSRR